MSEKTNEQALREAEQLLMDQVAYPAFAEKLASYGVQWANDDEFAMLDALGTRLYEQYGQRQQTVNPLLKRAYDSVFGEESPDARMTHVARQGVQANPSIKQAAVDYVYHLSELEQKQTA